MIALWFSVVARAEGPVDAAPEETGGPSACVKMLTDAETPRADEVQLTVARLGGTGPSPELTNIQFGRGSRATTETVTRAHLSRRHTSGLRDEPNWRPARIVRPPTAEEAAAAEAIRARTQRAAEQW